METKKKSSINKKGIMKNESSSSIKNWDAYYETQGIKPKIESMDIQIIRATNQDLDKITELWVELMKDHEIMEPGLFKDTVTKARYYKDKLEEDFEDDEHNRIFIIKDEMGKNSDKKIKGYISGNINFSGTIYSSDPIGYINDLYIVPSFQNKGYGKQLINQLMNWFGEKNIKKVELLVVLKNTRALELFKSFQFETYGMIMSFQL